MRKFIFTLGLLLIFIGLVITRKDDIVSFYNTYLSPNKVTTILEKNEYYRDYDFEFVQNVDNIVPNSRQDLLNIYYSVLNSGNDNFTFYCPKSYERCLKEIQIFANDQEILSDINNYVHPYNSFSHIETEYDSLGRVTIVIKKSYNNDDINMINRRVDKIYNEVVDPNKSIEENIKNIHDYIINNTIYDSDRSDKNIINYRSDIAYGPLFQGYGICGGYSDLMELFLEKLNVKSFKVSSEEHIWNAVYLNNRWSHLDLTWDDPVASDGKNYLQHDFFLINTSKLLEIETTQHDFDQNIFSELKEANN